MKKRKTPRGDGNSCCFVCWNISSSNHEKRKNPRGDGNHAILSQSTFFPVPINMNKIKTPRGDGNSGIVTLVSWLYAKELPPIQMEK